MNNHFINSGTEKERRLLFFAEGEPEPETPDSEMPDAPTDTPEEKTDGAAEEADQPKSNIDLFREAREQFDKVDSDVRTAKAKLKQQEDEVSKLEDGPEKTKIQEQIEAIKKDLATKEEELKKWKEHKEGSEKNLSDGEKKALKISDSISDATTQLKDTVARSMKAIQGPGGWETKLAAGIEVLTAIGQAMKDIGNVLKNKGEATTPGTETPTEIAAKESKEKRRTRLVEEMKTPHDTGRKLLVHKEAAEKDATDKNVDLTTKVAAAKAGLDLAKKVEQGTPSEPPAAKQTAIKAVTDAETALRAAEVAFTENDTKMKMAKEDVAELKAMEKESTELAKGITDAVVVLKAVLKSLPEGTPQKAEMLTLFDTKDVKAQCNEKFQFELTIKDGTTDVPVDLEKLMPFVTAIKDVLKVENAITSVKVTDPKVFMEMVTKLAQGLETKKDKPA